MMTLDVRLAGQPIGWLCHDPASNQFAFSYLPEWINAPQAHPISPNLPLGFLSDLAPETHSAIVRQFFENLMPEGEALDVAAASSQISKANLVGLLIALGRETSGALSVHPQNAEKSHAHSMRFVGTNELSDRIRARPHKPFAVWDGKVRLSIAGYQDKIALYQEDTSWFMVDGGDIASTHILKPEPVSVNLAGLTSNEFICMRLAKKIGLPVANVSLLHVPEPILCVERFDRRRVETGIQRLHMIDGCQLLGLSAAMKYERPYGDGAQVKDIRDGASLPRLFSELNNCPQPAAQRLQLLRWVIFQILIGNTDAHAKNVSFYCDHLGIRLTPAYDMVCCEAFAQTGIEETYAMAIGDAFSANDLNAYEWANFADQCGINPRLVAMELKKSATQISHVVADVVRDCLEDGIDSAVASRVRDLLLAQCEKQLALTDEIASASARYF